MKTLQYIPSNGFESVYKRKSFVLILDTAYPNFSLQAHDFVFLENWHHLLMGSLSVIINAQQFNAILGFFRSFRRTNAQ